MLLRPWHTHSHTRQMLVRTSLIPAIVRVGSELFQSHCASEETIVVLGGRRWRKNVRTLGENEQTLTRGQNERRASTLPRWARNSQALTMTIREETRRP